MIQETERRTTVAKRPMMYNAREIDWQNPEFEPTLDEILADPIVLMVMGSDHLERSDVERFLRSASARLAKGQRVCAA